MLVGVRHSFESIWVVGGEVTGAPDIGAGRGALGDEHQRLGLRIGAQGAL